jgi:hypothetical protein
MRRLTLSAVAAAVLFPGAVLAQNPSVLEAPAWGPRLQFTTFVGFAPAVSRFERWAVAGPGGIATQNYDVELGTGLLAGASAEMGLVDRFALIGSAVFITRGRTTEVAQDEGGTRFQHEGSNFIMAKGAIALRMRESISELQMHSLSGTIFVGPAFVREMPKPDALADPVLLRALNYYGLNFGVDGTISLPFSGLSFQMGIEDYLLWWDAVEIARRNDQVFANNGYQTTSRVETDPSHNFILRAGLSFRLR